MTTRCRRCKRQFDSSRNRACPHCGENQDSFTSGVLRTSTIVVSSRDAAGVYRSVKEVPADLRQQLLKTTTGENSATILIADKRGREMLARTMKRLTARRAPARRVVIHGAGALLAALTAALIWFVFHHNW